MADIHFPPDSHKPLITEARPAAGCVANPKPNQTDLVVNTATGAVLWNRASNTLIQPASLTKNMVAYLVFSAMRLHPERWNMHTPIIFSDRAVEIRDSAINLDGPDPKNKKILVQRNLPSGTSAPLGDLIPFILAPSANNITVAIAENLVGALNEQNQFVPGTETAAIGLMNQTAALLGLKDTRFDSASGLPDRSEGKTKQRSTLQDQARLALRLMHDFPEYMSFYRTTDPSAQFTLPNGQQVRLSKPGHNLLVSKLASPEKAAANGFQPFGVTKTGYINDSCHNEVVTFKNEQGIALTFATTGWGTAVARNTYLLNLARKTFAALPRLPQQDPRRAPFFQQPLSEGAAAFNNLAGQLRNLLGQGQTADSPKIAEPPKSPIRPTPAEVDILKL